MGATVGEAADITLATASLPQLYPERAEAVQASATWLSVLARPVAGLSPIQTKTRLAVVWPQLASAAVHPFVTAPKVTHEFRDPIHAFIRLDSEERTVLDSPFMQRLRHVHQLAFSGCPYLSAP